ncbi:uncharacterized protein [Dysidea avara]|uniref:uncharacterized protein n=1 Tax=Dysidea avara TaxID=196820 RepID=UPI003333F2DF
MTATVVMLLTRIMLIILSVLFIQHVEAGNKGTVVITVSEEDECIELFVSGDLSDGSGISQDVISPCCTTGNCTGDSFLHALVNLTDDVKIYITTDVVLSSIVPIVGVENITIIGHDSPTVYCNNKGGVRFVSCNNVIVEGIVWKECGSKNSPTLGIFNSSNITIQQCIFYHSRYQAVQLSNVSEHVYINNCTFAHNFLHTRGWRHGAVTFYLSQNSQVNLTIDNCYFIKNRGAKSVVYIYGNSDKPISVRNSVFTNNHMVSIYVYNHSLHINGNVTFENNKGSSIFVLYSNITFAGNSAVTFYNNSAHYGGAIYSDDNSVISFKGHCRVNFTANRAVVDGGAVYSLDDSVISFEGSSIITFAKNMANWGGAMYSKYNSNISFKGDSKVTYDENRALQNGGAIYLDRNSVISFQEHSLVRIDNNNAILGGAIFYFIECSILFEGHSKVTFSKNNAIGTGGAIHSDDNYILSFKGNTEVTFTENNAARSGGAITNHKYNNISFEGQSVVLFERNTAEIDGGAIYSSFHSMVSIKEQSEALFLANRARAGGGAVYFTDNSSLLFTRHSKSSFTDNTAIDGGAMCFKNNSVALFEGNSVVACTKNSATQNGGAIYSYKYSDILFSGDAVVIFIQNNATLDGGAIFSVKNCNISSEENSTITFTSNIASRYSGAIYSAVNSAILFGANSTVTFLHNIATSGGAVCSHDNSDISFIGNSMINFTHNTALKNGGVIYTTTNSSIRIEGKFTNFISNTAMNGGAIFTVQSILRLGGESVVNSKLLFSRNSRASFVENTAMEGGAMCSKENSITSFQGSSTVTYTKNSATQNGGAVYSDQYSVLLFAEDAAVIFSQNNATMSGGAVYSLDDSNILFKGNSMVRFTHNAASQNGGAMYTATNSDVIFEGNYSKFMNNTALNGGAIYTVQSIMRSREESVVIFGNNTALDSGGAIYFSDHSKVIFNRSAIFFNNLAHKYGGAINAVIDQSRLNFGTNFYQSFYDNVARVSGNKLYMAVPKSCDINCLNNSILNISSEVLQNNLLHNDITTTPNKIKYYHPAICINKSTTSGVCESYFVNNIILGQEIKVDACVLDYYDQPSSAVQLIVIDDNDHNYQIDGGRDLLILCGSNAFQGISIIGDSALSFGTFNVSMTINFHVDLFSDDVQFSIKFVVEISPCHPGFWHYKKSQKCVCYDGNNIVFCSGTNSTIKRGYWFGSVNGQPTVAVCPVNYCDFSCCETTDGFYHLSPLRVNQCRSHRSGPACGNCEEGWTLSFDSAECVKTEKCTAGQTALVVILTVLYWIAVVVAAFILMYFKVSVGNLYVITYYYSILDALLNQTLYLSQWLLATFNTVASIFKITPQFLGQLCLVKGMSGIDQQFIHFVHPFAVSLILLAITLLARISYRFSSFISRGIIHVICLLLLLSYTSVATTSLLLMRTLTFLDVDKIYTYLSPDIEYFHGRHLPYAIVAVLCTIVIVIGLPLLLLLEPFLNQRLNFTRFKPLLDQFQGCYKDKYRYFAAYYMICRLVIITIIITTPSNNVLVQYILICICAIMAGIQLILRPYMLQSLNTFDGLILLFMVSVVTIPVLDSSKTDVLVGITLFVVLLPLTLFVIMLLVTLNNNIRKMTTSCKHNQAFKNVEIPVSEFGIIVDDNMRRNATICDV